MSCRYMVFFVFALAHSLPAQAADTATLAAQSFTSAEPTSETLPSIFATHVSRHEPSGQEFMTATVELSPRGLKVREAGADARLEILQDFNSDTVWLIDRVRRVRHQLPLVDMPELGLATPGAASSFLGSEPCGVLTMKDQGPGTWRGRRVRAFHCLDENMQVLKIDLLDDIHRIVVFSQSSDGYIDELHNLVARTYEESHFEISTRFRKVDKHEFFHGVPELERYSFPED